MTVEHVHAASRLQYCRIVKTTVLYENRFWTKGKFKPSGRGYSWFTDGVSDFCFDATKVRAMTNVELFTATPSVIRPMTWLMRRCQN